MVVGRETRLGESPGLVLREHAERAARFHPQIAHSPDHRQHVVELIVLRRVAPSGPHAETRGAIFLRLAGLLEHLIDVEQGVPFDIRVVMGALGAIAAVLGAVSRLDAQQRATLHFVRIVKPPVFRLRPIY